MLPTNHHTVKTLFARPSPEAGSNAARLQEFHNRRALQREEARLADKQQRLEKRRTNPSSTPSFFR